MAGAGDRGDDVPVVAAGRGEGDERGRGVFCGAMLGAVRTVRVRVRGLAPLPAVGLTLAPGWRKTSDVVPPTVHSFTEAQGLTTVLPPGTSPISFFEQIFGTDYFDNLAETTNLNAVVEAPPVGWGPH